MGASSSSHGNQGNQGDTPLKGVEVIKQFIRVLPASPGVYRMVGKAGQILYIGKARDLKKRVVSYTHLKKLPARLQRMVMATASMEVTTTRSEIEALLLEASLIKELQPQYNILLKDNKSYPYICLTASHPYPRIMKYRGNRSKQGEYFGPYVSAGAVNETIALLQRAFLLRPCSDTIFKNRSRPCLQYQIKRCSAPCVGYVSEEEYATLLSQAREYLKGKSSAIQAQLEQDMQAAANAEAFEEAARLRDRLQALNKVQQHSAGYQFALHNTDIVAVAMERNAACVSVASFRAGAPVGSRHYYPVHVEEKAPEEVLAAFIMQFYGQYSPPAEVLVNCRPVDNAIIQAALTEVAGKNIRVFLPERGRKLQAVGDAERNAREALKRHIAQKIGDAENFQRIAEIFGLEAEPNRIEIYDNSHISGAHAVGAMVVVTKEGFDKKSYRTFKIKRTDLTPGDDYAMMREVLFRRLRKLLDEEQSATQKPDLILIDGGAGQLSAVEEIFAQLGISDIGLVAIAKGADRNAGRERFFMPGEAPFQLPIGDSALHFLQRLRDEAHRFVIGTHRARRSKAIRETGLDKVPGIGAARKKALIRYFGSAKAVGSASVEQISQVEGISGKLAEQIHAYLHG